MNYERIYNELIEHRKMMPKIEGEYYEKHHILARSLGGGDEAENLIYLTAEDHFMAHLLLAKVHGGSMWYALNLLKPQVDKGHRAAYALMKKALARKDTTLYRIVETRTGEVFEMLRYDIALKYNLSIGMMNRLLVKGKKCKGVCLEKNYEKDPWYFTEDFEFINKDTNDTIKGTLQYIADKLGVVRSRLVNIIKGRMVSVYGYSWSESPEKPPKECKPRAVKTTADTKIYKLVNVISGAEFVGTRKQAKETLGLSRGQIGGLIQNKTKKAGNWTFPEMGEKVELYRVYDAAQNKFFVGTSVEIQKYYSHIGRNRIRRMLIGYSKHCGDLVCMGVITSLDEGLPTQVCLSEDLLATIK